METTRAELNESLSSLNVDYGYEEHIPLPRSEFDPVECRSTASPFEAIDATEISESLSHHECSAACFDLNEADYPPMPADRQARKQRSFKRRGGAVHASLLKSAVMASMAEYDSSDDVGSVPNRRGSCQSSISLQSLQDALRTDTSPRKRARRGRRMGQDNEGDDDDDNDENDDINEASNMFDTLRMSSGPTSARKEPVRREPPARRVSRKTSYDSRVSDFDSETSDWEN
jgi:hypothetical protein